MPKRGTRKRAERLNRYSAILEQIFHANRKQRDTVVPFGREEFQKAAESLGIRIPKNVSDIPYSHRYRALLIPSIVATQPEGKEWIIRGTGKGQYAFRLGNVIRIVPDPNYLPIKIPDATPELIAAWALSDEQALLAKVRYNRLIDTFLGLTTYSLQSHLRTTVRSIGQLEIDEVYVGVDKSGAQFVIPVQAKGGRDQLSPVQTEQDIICCREKFPNLVCRSVSAQFMADDVIALFELYLVSDEVKIVDQRHYKLVPSQDITDADLKSYRTR